MIDHEVDIFNELYSVVAPLCANNKFVSAQIVSPVALPAASLIEIDNSTVRDRQSSTPGENYAVITYQLDVYASTKHQCKAIFSKADERMILLGFNRISMVYSENGDNPHVHRYIGRYRAEIDQNGTLYRHP